MLAGIRDILIISTPQDVPRFQSWEYSLHLQHQIKSWLLELGYTHNKTYNIPWVWNENLPSFALWKQLQQPVFDSKGRPGDILPWNTLVPNPFYQLPGVTGTIASSKNVALNQLLNPIAILDQRHQSVVGQNEILATLRFHHHRLACASDPRVDDCHKHRARREIGTCTIEEAGAIEYGERRDLMREIHDAQLGRNRVHHAFAERYGIVHHAEIGHEDDGRRGWRHALCADRQIGDAKQQDESEQKMR